MSDRYLAHETAAAAQLKLALEAITDDETAVRDTIDGSTNLRSAIGLALLDLDEDELLLIGIERSIEALAARKARCESRIERRRAAMYRAMDAGQIDKLVYPSGTLSLRMVAAKLEVVNETKIPSKYFEPQPPKLNRAALKDDLKSGKQIDGAVLSNGSLTLAIRRG